MLLAPWIGAWLSDGTDLDGARLYLVQGVLGGGPSWTVIALQASRRMGQLVVLENASSLMTAILPGGLALAGFGLLGVFTGQVIASLIAVGIGFVLYRRLVADDPLFPTIGELLRGIVGRLAALAVDAVRALDRVRQGSRFAVQPGTDSPARHLRARG